MHSTAFSTSFIAVMTITTISGKFSNIFGSNSFPEISGILISKATKEYSFSLSRSMTFELLLQVSTFVNLFELSTNSAVDKKCSSSSTSKIGLIGFSGMPIFNLSFFLCTLAGKFLLWYQFLFDFLFLARRHDSK